jgi:hypothetical protein
MGSLPAPHFFQFAVSPRKRRQPARAFSGDAHRESGVIQLVFSSKPGGVMLPPEPDELTLLMYSCTDVSASEIDREMRWRIERPGS